MKLTRPLPQLKTVAKIAAPIAGRAGGTAAPPKTTAPLGFPPRNVFEPPRKPIARGGSTPDIFQRAIDRAGQKNPALQGLVRAELGLLKHQVMLHQDKAAVANVKNIAQQLNIQLPDTGRTALGALKALATGLGVKDVDSLRPRQIFRATMATVKTIFVSDPDPSIGRGY